MSLGILEDILVGISERTSEVIPEEMPVEFPGRFTEKTPDVMSEDDFGETPECFVGRADECPSGGRL